MAPAFVCKRCGYFTTMKNSLLLHFGRKKLCPPRLQDIPIEELVNIDCSVENNEIIHNCEWCNKNYSNISNLYRHKKNCVEKPIESNVTNDETNLRIQELQDQLNRLIESRSSSGNILNNTTNNIDNSSTTNNTTNNNINNSTNLTIIMNNFGQEKIDHILKDHAFMKKCFKNLLSHGIIELMRKIHFDKEHPENHNVKFKSLKRDFIEIFKDDSWRIVSGTQTSEDMTRKGCVLLSQFYDEMMREDMDDEDNDRYRSKIRTISSKTGNEYYAVRKNTKAMVFDESKRMNTTTT
jgi:hypothetical protein